ncbi:hypothetical protein [Rheinheimera hassiensis]|uniref:hypothetical protein n=1 Tax=Rheinheimera hassiensis TaxID=1193627 RepID=UPI001F065D08|nr:hypothetical protein [Rheinheimera hassiensis]
MKSNKQKWIFCPCCEGSGKMENPAFANGFTSSEWHDMHEEEQQRYLAGEYDVDCGDCNGSGKVQVPNIEAMTFAEKRQLVIVQREAREAARADAIEAAEWRRENGWGYGC